MSIKLLYTHTLYKIYAWFMLVVSFSHCFEISCFCCTFNIVLSCLLFAIQPFYQMLVGIFHLEYCQRHYPLHALSVNSFDKLFLIMKIGAEETPQHAAVNICGLYFMIVKWNIFIVFIVFIASRQFTRSQCIVYWKRINGSIRIKLVG